MNTEESGRGGSNGEIPLTSRPTAMSFLFRYLTALTPLLLVALSLLAGSLQERMYSAASHMVPLLAPAHPGSTPASSAAAMSQYLASMNLYMTGINEIMAITVLLIAPVGIFLLAAGIGGSLRLTEMWTGSLLTLVLSTGGALVLASSPAFTATYAELVLRWIAFLVQPFCIFASAVMLWHTDAFRRSIEYTVMPGAIRIRGGVFRHVDQWIPIHGTGRIVLEQDLVGARFNYGTIIPRPDPVVHQVVPDSVQGVPDVQVSERYGNFPASGLKDLSRDPLDCLYGIPEPEAIRRILEARAGGRSSGGPVPEGVPGDQHL